MDGVCPNCGAEGAAGASCPKEGCAAQGYCFVPPEYRDDWSTGLLGRDALIGKRIGEHLVVRRIGEGGFGAVYLALQLPIGMRVALKVLKEQRVDPEREADIRDRFEREAATLARLTHPNIVRLIKFGVDSGVPFMVMEYAPGDSLSQRLAAFREAGRVFSIEETRHLVRQLLHGLQAAHDEDIVHRDIKPGNLVIQQVRGDPLFLRILDFGLVKLLSGMTDSTMAQGTPVYMAPEQLRGRDIGPWTDLYAVGLVAFELLTGLRCFVERSSEEIFARKLDPTHDFAQQHQHPRLTPEVRSFFRRAAAPFPEDRYRAADAFAERFEAVVAPLADAEATARTASIRGDGIVETRTGSSPFASGSPGVVGPHETTQAPRTRSSVVRIARSLRSGWKIPALVVALVVAFIGGYHLLTPDGEDTRRGVDVSATSGPNEGGEFQVNVETALHQSLPAVTGGPDGGFVVTWKSNHLQDGEGEHIFLRRYTQDGRPAGAPVQVSRFGPSQKDLPDVATFPDGRTLVVWLSEDQDGDAWGVFGQWFDERGEKLRGEFLVNSCYTTLDQGWPSVAALSDGHAIVVWQSYGQDGSDEGIIGQRFASDGSRDGECFILNDRTEGRQRYPAVVALSGGGFVSVWECKGGQQGIWMRVFGADGIPRAPAFLVNTHDQGLKRYPSVADLGERGLVVLWTSRDQDGSGRGVFGQIFSPDGERLGEEFGVNTTTQRDQWLQQVATDPSTGESLALWLSDGQDGSGAGIFGQRLAPDGSLIGDEFQVNAWTHSDQRLRDVASLGPGRFVAVWESRDQDGDGWGVYGRIVEWGP